ncbi:MAG: DNA repair protein RecN [Oscillospiraceae bacterium]|jgi:DNA repair protein RecN (Recombination protein N)|nr:DNA repair protein RecN [Oscillospiraceae bacterium]MCX4257027.1 DNA repair protein RecN [Oscillospiraceae bacterium]
MLSELYIENLAVIQKAEIPLTESFNVFTGETGAGKSILVGGINAVLGKRISRDMVRSGCEKATVSAMFRHLTPGTVRKLSELGISCEDDELMITREISADGGSSARINSKAAPISAVRELGETLIDVHGQHDNKILMYPEKHINIIDDYAELHGQLDDYRKSFRELQDTARRIKKLAVLETEKQQRVEYLNRFLAEVGELELENENEDTEIENEFTVANNSSVLAETISRSHMAVCGSEDSTGMTESIDSVISDLAEYSDIMPSLSPLINRLDAARIELSDIGDELTRLLDGIDVDEQRLEYLSDRREKLYSIKKRYSCTLAELIARYDSYSGEAKEIAGCAKEIQDLTKAKNRLLAEVSEKAEKLSEARSAASGRFTEKIAEELKFLDMPNVKILFRHEKGKLTANGMDVMELMISVNAGEPPKPIAKIASGGELSRIMLAIKNVVAEKEDTPTMIFDEIDTGVSGRAAQKIGVKLRQVSKTRQVICVTHLSQIAVMADNHLLIEKTSLEDSTVTSVTQLDRSQRVGEIARILGGEHITKTTLDNAAEQLDGQEKIYNEILNK